VKTEARPMTVEWADEVDGDGMVAYGDIPVGGAFLDSYGGLRLKCSDSGLDGLLWRIGEDGLFGEAECDHFRYSFTSRYRPAKARLIVEMP